MIMKNKKHFMEYGIDISYELKTYKYIGSDYGNSKNANKGLSSNISRWLRKHIINKNEKQYKICNKYSEWEKYVTDNAPKNVLNGEDLLHYLYKNRMFMKIYYDIIKILLIPIYIAMLEILECICPDKNVLFVLMILVMIVIVIFSTGIIIDANQRINFYNDYISVLESVYINDIN